MALASEDIPFIKDHLGEWLAEQSLGKLPAVYEIERHARLVRVEEQRKHQCELMRAGFARMDERFAAAEQRHRRSRQDLQERSEELTRRIDRFMIWSFGHSAAIGGLAVRLVEFWNP